MSQRETNLLWLGDLLEQLRERQQQLQWGADGEVERLLTESMLRDLETCRRLCESLRNRRGQRVPSEMA